MTGSDRFEVDVEALYRACLGIRRIVGEFQENPVRDIDAKADFGHAGLDEAMEGFSNRWQRGVKNLLVDADAIDKRLGDTLKAYQEADQAAIRAFDSIYGGEN